MTNQEELPLQVLTAAEQFITMGEYSSNFYIQLTLFVTPAMRIQISDYTGLFSRHQIHSIYHASSILNACHFLKKKMLLSRGIVESSGLHQHAQQSDGLDKTYGVYFDVFADISDIHGRVKKPNKYGPVMFEFEAAIIDRTH